MGDGLRSFQYDAQARHNKTVVSDSDEGSKATYLYNALGQRVFKSIPQVDHTAPSEAALGRDFINWLRTNFGWLFVANPNPSMLGDLYMHADPNPVGLPAWALLGELTNGGDPTMTGWSDYIWLPLEDGTALAVAHRRYGSFYSVHADHLGTPRQLKDAQNKVAWQLPYSAFGETRPSGPMTATVQAGQPAGTPPLLKATMPLALNLRFPGQYFDSESNLNYNYFRSYDPKSGRYTQADPIGLDAGWNRMTYVEGNPLMFADPDGRLPLIPIAISVASGGALAWTLKKQAACETACQTTLGEGAVASCGNPERQDLLDLQSTRRISACKAQCAFSSAIGQLLPKLRP